MVIQSFIIIERGPTPKHLRGHLRRIMKDTIEKSLATYHRQNMDKHFTPEGAREYGYTPRSGQQGGLSRKEYFRSYTGRKQRQKGHTNPLQWSGASRVLAQIRDVRASSRRGRLVQHARGLNRRNPASSVDMAKEISSVSDKERQTTRDLFGRLWLKHSEEIRQESRTTIK